MHTIIKLLSLRFYNASPITGTTNIHYMAAKSFTECKRSNTHDGSMPSDHNNTGNMPLQLIKTQFQITCDFEAVRTKKYIYKFG